MGSGYKVSRRIGRGGMAEVYLALREGVGGFEKLVVVKRIFSHFCKDQRFVTMFLDEARLAASISHPNVVEIFDIGEDEEGYFMAMEYLSGETLALIFETLRAKQSTIPAPIVARIGADVAAGLHYAHTATDGSGTPLDIVHRDVTPSNIIVCFNGTTKIVDFGIAKAQVRDSHTRSGALKGKMAYLSPEQIQDGHVDHRTDVFQLGTTLHELLTGVRLFDAEGDHQKMLAVMERPIRPPSQVNPYVPKVFDDVVMRALQRDVTKRTQSADYLRRELEYALKQLGTTVSDHDVADWMQSTFAARYTERVTMERASVSEMRSGVRSRPGPGGSSDSDNRTPTMATVVGKQKSRAAGKRRRLAPWLIAIGGVVGVALGALFFWHHAAGSSGSTEGQGQTVQGGAEGMGAAPAREAAPRRYLVSIEVSPSDAVISIDGKSFPPGGIARTFEIDGKEHQLRVTAPGYETYEFTFVDAPPRDHIRLEEIQPDTTGATDAAPAAVAEHPSAGGPTPQSPSPAPADRDPPRKKGTVQPKKTETTVESQDRRVPPDAGPRAVKPHRDEWKTNTGSDNIDPWQEE